MSDVTPANRLTLMHSAINHHIGLRIRLRRRTMGLAQHQLADLIGVTGQQVHKYEIGMNRISAGQIHAIALALGTDVAFFFESVEPKLVETDQQDHQCQLIELVHNVRRIEIPGYQHAICAMARAMADRSD